MRALPHLVLPALLCAVVGCGSSGSDLFNPNAGGDASTDLDGTASSDGACANACQAGSLECVGDAIRVCVVDKGCAQWGKPSPCPSSAPFCSSGKCAATCSDECNAAGSRRCSGAGYQVCGQYDTDPCLEWGAPIACATGTLCSGNQGECKPQCKGPGCDGGTSDSAADVIEPPDAKPESSCSANCNAKLCGADDGCGHVCLAGTCGYGLHCVSGTCACDSSSCWGCCSGGACQLGTSSSACGSAGNQCQPCPTGTVCNSAGSCVCEPSCWGKGCNASDGCGGTCTDGDCGSGYYCAADGCKPCVPYGGNCQGDPGHCCSFTCGTYTNVCN